MKPTIFKLIIFCLFITPVAAYGLNDQTKSPHFNTPLALFFEHYKNYRNMKNAKAFLEVIESSVMAVENLERGLNYIAEQEFTAKTKPLSLGSSIKTWNEYGQVLSEQFSGQFINYDVGINEISAFNNRVVMEGRSVGVSIDNHQYAQDFVITIEFNSIGQIVSYEEFVDSLFTVCFLGIIECDG